MPRRLLGNIFAWIVTMSLLSKMVKVRKIFYEQFDFRRTCLMMLFQDTILCNPLHDSIDI